MKREIPVPRYYQIVHQLEKFIQENDCAPGEKLPSENDLVTTYGVSRITARRALEEMERTGLVTKQRGKGTYVAKRPKQPDLPRFTGSIDGLFMIGAGGTVKLASVEEVIAPPKVKAALQLDDPDTTVTRIHRVLLLHGKPYASHQNFYPLSIGSRIDRRDVLKHALFDILEKKLHIPVLQVSHVIEAALADTEIAEQLEVSFGSPLLYVERTLLGEKATPIGFTQAYYRGDGYRLSVTLVKEHDKVTKRWRSSE